MGVRITSIEKKVALFDSTNGFAFGPTFDTEDEAERFLAYCEQRGYDDLRREHNDVLAKLHDAWATDVVLSEMAERTMFDQDSPRVLSDEDSAEVISMLRPPMAVHTMYTNTGCELKVHGDATRQGSDIEVVTPVGARVQGTVQMVHPTYIVVRNDEFNLRAYFDRGDCPDL